MALKIGGNALTNLLQPLTQNTTVQNVANAVADKAQGQVKDTFQRAAATGAATGTGNGGHVNSSDDDVNTKVNAFIDDYNQHKTENLSELTQKIMGFVGNGPCSGIGMQFCVSDVQQYVKDHPDASMEEVDKRMVDTGICMKCIVDGLKKFLDKITHWKKDDE